MIEAIAGLVAAIAQIFLEIVVYLLTLILTSAYFSARTKGVSRIASVIATLLGLYLFVAILRGFVPTLASPSVSYYFPSILIGIIFVLFLLFLSIPFAILAAQKRRDSSDDSEFKVPWLFTYLLSIAIVFGGIVLWSNTYKVPTMEERFCANLAIKIDPTISEKAAGGLAILEDFLDHELHTNIPCINTDELE